MRVNAKSLLKQAMFSIYKCCEKMGVHILPVHYYSPVSNLRELKKTTALWQKKSALPGLYIDLDEQVNNMREICLKYQEEYKENKAYKFAVEHKFGLGYGYIEAQALHGVIRHYKPKRIVEVGSGVSTWCMINAVKLNKEETGEQCEINCVEPHPSNALKSFSEIKLIEKTVQSVSYEDVFEKLTDNDMLFIDSSHAVKPGSDVNYLILEILPRLKAGTIVHFHDIYIPYDYKPAVLKSVFDWTETSLLRAFLIHNDRAKIIFCEFHLHCERPDDMKKVFPEYKPRGLNNGVEDINYRHYQDNSSSHRPSSIFLKMQ